MKNINSASSLVAVATLVLGGLGIAATAQAGDVYWTVGVSSPGVQVGVGNGGRYGTYPPAYVQPYPVYVQPYSGYTQPYPVYVAPNPVVYVRPAPVYVTQYQYAPVEWQRPGPGWRHGHRHHPHNQYDSGGYDRDGGYSREGGRDGRHAGHHR